MKISLQRLCLMMLVGAAIVSAEPSAFESRDWLINGQANNRTSFKGTFVKYENGRVYIKLPDGYVRPFIAAQLCDRDLWYLQQQLCVLPNEAKKATAGMEGKLLVDLTAEGLAAGQLKEWKNRGALGGSFHAIGMPLTVETLDGRKSVKFYFGAWAVPLEYQAMASDFNVPANVVKGGAYTVSLLVYNASPLGIDAGRETMLSWHGIKGDGDSSDFNYGLNGRYTKIESRGSGAYVGPLGSFSFADEVYPAFNRWHHMAYVYSGGKGGTLRVYVDGVKIIEKENAGSDGAGPDDKLMFLGCTWGGNTPRSFFTGNMAGLQVYSKALSENEIKSLAKSTPPQDAASRVKPKVVNAHNLFEPYTNGLSYFSPEWDGLVSEPFPKDIRQNGEFGKFMEGGGHPVISRTRCPDEAMVLCAYTMGKTLTKRPDITEVLEAMDCAARLDPPPEPWLGYCELLTACYGQTRTFYADPGFYWGGNIMVHEMGHQFHMFGGEHAEADFRKKLFDVFWQNKKDGKWSGDYGGLNMWEYMACAVSAYVSDGTEEDGICRRESFRRYDPRMFYFLQDYWAGDTLIDLTPQRGLRADASGAVTAWDNSGGLEYWGKFGLTKHPWSMGAFEAKGSPRTATLGGVASVAFAGSDALVWTKRTRECLVENHAWSVELWAYRDEANSNNVMLSWGPADTGARFMWGAGTMACDLGKGRTTSWKNKPGIGAWHHILYTYRGGGLTNGNGRLAVYVDGALDHTASFKLDIPTAQAVVVGGTMEGTAVKPAFSGALAHVRVYDYDLHETQLAKHYKEEQPFYVREKLANGTLLVDLDARMLAVPTEYQFRPLYPQSVGKSWLRAWANRGVLGGKLSNDVHPPEGSKPTCTNVAGIAAVVFDGGDRMVSSFTAVPQVMKAPVTVEAWVCKSAADKGGVILQWGGIAVPSTVVPAGQWHLVSLVLNGAKATAYVDGKEASAPGVAVPGAEDRLHLGAKWDGKSWSGFFAGAIAQVRVCAGALTAEAIARNMTSSDLLRASQPWPAMGERIAAERKNAFTWIAGLKGEKQFELYIATDPALVAAGDAKSACYAGKIKAGDPAPKLKPGTAYYWRVDGLDGQGAMVSRGTVWSFKTYEGLVVSLDAEKLATGAVEKWPNEGRAGGVFAKGDIGDIGAPEVATWDGRKAVDFTGGKCLVSSFEAPASLSGARDFTIAFWAYNAVLDKTETMMAWGKGDRMAKLEYGWDATAVRQGGTAAIEFGGEPIKTEDHSTKVPMVTYWNHIAYVYAAGTLRIYVNGILNNEKKVALDIGAGGRIAIGAVLDEDGRRAQQFSGMLADIAVYDYALAVAEVGYLCTGTGKLPTASRLLVKLSCEEMPDGKLAAWKNKGSAGGAFAPPERKTSAPVAETVAGRKAVTFDGKTSFMRSDISTPRSVTRINPVTIETWVNNPQVGDETVFSLAPRRAYSRVYFEGTTERALEMRYAPGDERSPGAVNTGMGLRSLGWRKDQIPAPGAWHHIAFVYDGNRPGVGCVYVDGAEVNRLGFYTICTVEGLPMYLGTAWNTDYGTQDMYSGSLASIRVYDYARTGEEIAAAARAGK